MTEFRRYALFQLAVTGLAAVAVAAVYSLFHSLLASLAGFALLGLLGLWPIVRRQTVADERDEAIQRQAALTGYVVLWLALVAWSVSMTLAFGERGSVPMVWVAPLVWVAWWLVTVVRSVTILILDQKGS